MDLEFKTCPECFTENDINAKFCNNCGFNFQNDYENEFNINVFYNLDDLVDDAVLMYIGEDYNQSLELIDSYLEFSPKDAYAFSFKAHVLNKLGFIKDSITCCDIALNIDDMCEVAWLSKVYFYYILKNYEASLSCCEAYLILDSQNSYVEHLKGFVLSQIYNSGG